MRLLLEMVILIGLLVYSHRVEHLTFHVDLRRNVATYALLRAITQIRI